MFGVFRGPVRDSIASVVSIKRSVTASARSSRSAWRYSALLARPATLDKPKRFFNGARRGVRLGFRELGSPARREFRRVEIASLHLEHPDIFATRFVGLRHWDKRGVDHGERAEIRKAIVVRMNGCGQSRTEEVHVVREDHNEVDFRNVGRRTNI